MKRLALVLTLLLFGCDGEGPTFMGGDAELFFPGTLSADEITRSHGFDLTSSGTVQVQLDQLSALAGDTGEPIEIDNLTVALGRPDADECISTRSAALAPGESFIVFLTPASFCINLTRPLLFPLDATIDYTVSVTRALS